MASSAISEIGLVACVAIAFIVVGLITENGVLYGVLEAVGVLPSVV
jgi:hypothetical protein